MILRKYRSSDCEKMAQLFYETVHSVNAADYTEEQLDTTHASITAKPFFLKRGYRAVKEQKVERAGVFLTNYVMEKYSSGGAEHSGNRALGL